jgi:excisionase family DNA binding protein
MAKSRKRYATVQQASDFCGLSPRTIRRLIARGALVAYRPVRGRILVDLVALKALVLASADPSHDREGGHR